MKTENRFKHYHISINGITFHVCGKLDRNYSSLSYHGFRLTQNLTDVYKKPSAEKVKTFNAWWLWFYDLKRDCGIENEWAITGHNCNFYSLGGKIRFTDSETGELKAYALHITYLNNYAYEIEPW